MSAIWNMLAAMDGLADVVALFLRFLVVAGSCASIVLARVVIVRWRGFVSSVAGHRLCDTRIIATGVTVRAPRRFN
jgi:hypothetical protein